MRVAFSKPVHAARARVGQPSPNHGTLTAKPSSHHVHVTLQVTPPTSPCPTLSANAEPVRNVQNTIFSVQCTVWCNQNSTIGFKRLLKNETRSFATFCFLWFSNLFAFINLSVCLSIYLSTYLPTYLLMLYVPNSEFNSQSLINACTSSKLPLCVLPTYDTTQQQQKGCWRVECRYLSSGCREASLFGPKMASEAISECLNLTKFPGGHASRPP